MYRSLPLLFYIFDKFIRLKSNVSIIVNNSLPKDFYAMVLTFIEFASLILWVLSRESGEEDLGAAGLLLCTFSAGPVSPICYDLKGRELATRCIPR
jgi:hypothetical protein